MPTTIRPAVPGDVAQLNAIHTHYVENTVSTFALIPYTLEQTQQTLEKITGTGLPFIVSTDSDPDEEVVTGYAYFSPFRSAKGGYLHTVELTLYCHPEHVSRGLGTALLNKILDIVQNAEEYGREWIGDGRKDEGRVREVICCMTVDPIRELDGEALARWYQRFGFEQMGRLKHVGKKFDRWLDTIYLQKHIS